MRRPSVEVVAMASVFDGDDAVGIAQRDGGGVRIGAVEQELNVRARRGGCFVSPISMAMIERPEFK